MGQKKTPAQVDMTRLKTKLQERSKASEKPDGDATIRALRKHLKRAQRKQRAQVLRKAHASGKKAEAKPAAAAS